MPPAPDLPATHPNESTMSALPLRHPRLAAPRLRLLVEATQNGQPSKEAAVAKRLGDC